MKARDQPGPKTGLLTDRLSSPLTPVICSAHEIFRDGALGAAGAMYPTYVRGEALLAEHNGAEAAVEFEKLIDHRGIMLADPAVALARLEIGRAWALSGDHGKAKSAYQDFLTLWKDADADIPILRQARAEYASLH
jgi:eukaryotic-like serine/threonine-protein kinase